MSEEIKVEKVNGTWNGMPISIKKVWGGHEFTADECAKLFNGEIIEFEAVSKNTGNTYTAKGKIEKQEYEGHEFYGFKPIFEKREEVERFSGTWNSQSVNVKRVWGGHRFTDEEVQILLDGGMISFEANKKDGSGTYTAKGGLMEQEYEGRTFVAFGLCRN